MKNSIKGIRISEDIKQLIVKGKKKVDLSDYPEIEKYLQTNKTAHHLVDKLSKSQYPLITEKYREEQVNSYFQILYKKQSQLKFRKRLTITISTVAAIMILSFLIISVDKKEEFKKIETFSANYTPTLIMEDGVTIDLTKVSPDSLKKVEQRRVNTNNQTIYNIVSIPHKYTYNIILDDGTEVFLNSCSELKYPKTFLGDERVVELKGEAFFKVTKSSKSFIIKTANTTVKVYGTSFNLLANSKVTETTLIEGSIGITQNSSGEEVRLLPNQRHILKDGLVKIDSIDAANSIGWLNNEFNFTQIPILELLTKISDWYGCSFEVPTNELTQIRIDVCSPRTMNIEQLIDVLESSTNLQFIKEKKDTYIVKRKIKYMN